MHGHYSRLALNLAVSAAVMYLVMFAMIDGYVDFYNNLNMFYMALMMAAPMGTLMLLMMRSMYDNRRLNRLLHACFALVFIGAFAATRTQAGIGDAQFLRSMIPHHSGAILMCREAKIADAEVRTFCRRIERTQREEIEQMRRILDRI